MSQSLPDLPWDQQSCCAQIGATWGTPDQLGHVLSDACKQHLTALRFGVLCPGSPNCSNFILRSSTLKKDHKQAPTSAALGLPHQFSSFQLVVDPQQHLQDHHPNTSHAPLPFPHSLPWGEIPPEVGNASSRSLCFPFRTAWRALGVQPHTGSSSEEGAGVPGWHQGTLAPLPRCPRRCLCEHGQPLLLPPPLLWLTALLFPLSFCSLSAGL